MRYICIGALSFLPSTEEIEEVHTDRIMKTFPRCGQGLKIGQSFGSPVRRLTTRNKAAGKPVYFKYFPLLVSLLFVTACRSSKDTKTVGVENDEWLFSYDSTNVGLEQQWFGDSCDRTSWLHVKSGHWSGVVGEAYNGAAWYASTFEISDTATPHAVFFGGVDDTAQVWINGNFVGSHEGSDEPFSFQLQGVHPGRNMMVVRVFNLGGPGGIYKPVQIVESDEVKDLLKSKFADLNARSSASWVHDAVIYEVYLRSFSKEGNFKGLERRLPELKSLGATVLWLMPIHPVGQLGRKGKLGSPYAVQDYYEINPEFGTLDDFKALVESAHKLGLNLLMDLVADHTAWDSKLMFDHPEWFKTNRDGLIVSPNADWTDVAQLDYRQHELRKYMINMMVYWVKDIGVDGFRCDVADLVPLDFWDDARKALDNVKPVMMLAEGKNPEDHIQAFDLTYAWNIYDVLLPVIEGNRTVNAFDNRLEREYLTYPKNSLRLRFSSNHDKNVQDGPAASLYTSAGAKAAAALVFTLPGVPLIYDGDEAGNTRKLDLPDKVGIDWSKGREFREIYSTLALFRSEHAALRYGKYRRLWCSDSSRVFAFERADSTDTIAVVINFSKDPEVVQVESGNAMLDLMRKQTFVPKRKTIELKLKPFGFSILSPEQTKGEQ